MKTAFIICSRLESRRVPNKCALNINGKTVLNHLIDRLKKTDISVILAIPTGYYSKYQDAGVDLSNISVYEGSESDPLKRMADAAKDLEIDNIIRVTHDKIFIEPEDVYRMIAQYHAYGLDYIYSSTFTAGTGFEIISKKALLNAAKQFKNVEHISYAIRSVTDNKQDFNFKFKYFPELRLLIDFPEDVDLMNTIFANLGNGCTQEGVFKFLNANRWARQLNRLPLLTVYTCALNADKWIKKAMGSVSEQLNFGNCEYILVDDHSTDKTSFLMSRFCSIYPNAKYIRNAKNVGLASSSNVALSHARGEYIVRLDADDYFISNDVLLHLIKTIKERDLDVVYPNNYYGSYNVVQRGNVEHHVGGAIFKTRALNHLKFTEKLRNLEGLDLYGKARKQLNLGYLNKPVFFYRQSVSSMSRTNQGERAILRKRIEKEHGLDANSVD